MLLVLLLQIFFAFCFIIFKKTLPYGEPFFLVGLRMILSGIPLLIYFYGIQKKKIRFTKNIIILVAIASIFNVYITNAFELWGLQYVTAAKTSFIYNFSPFLAALFSYLFLHETLTTKKWVGLLLGFAGFIPILLSTSPEEFSLCHVGFISLAEAAIIAAAIATSLGWISIKKLVYDERTSIAFANGSSMLIGGILSLINSWYTESWHPLPCTQFWPMLAYTFLGALLSCLICYNLYALLLKRYSATFLSFTGLITPLATAIGGWLWLHEPVTWQFVVSFIIVSIGLYYYYGEESKNLTAL